MLCYKCAQKILEKDATLCGLHEKCFLEWFKIKKDRHFTDVISKSFGSSETFHRSNTSFFHGKFKKYSAILDGKNYILKVQEKDFPELPATEYVCNLLARNVGIPVPDFFLIRFEQSIETFACENFMHKYPSSNLVHLYHFLKPCPEEFNCKTIFKIIEKKTQCLEDTEKFVELTLFDALIGNNDRHGRNLAFIESQKGFLLAPFYDNPSYLGTEIASLLGAQHEPRGQIYTSESNEPKMLDYVKEWSKLGQISVINQFREKIDINKLKDIVNKSFVSDKRKEAIKKLMTRRYLELMQ